MDVNSGQVDYESQHLLAKLKSRDRSLYTKVRIIKKLDVDTFFRVINGKVEDW